MHWRLVAEGTGASQGLAIGTALIIHRNRESRLEHLDEFTILVAKHADPATLGPYLPRSCGLVVERGGLLSHGVILARVLGLPTVIHAHGVLSRIRIGDRIKIDGLSGRIWQCEASNL